jgi:FdhE protein
MPSVRDPWPARIKRAEALASRGGDGSELLVLYGRLLRIQQGIYGQLRGNGSTSPSGALDRDLPCLQTTMREALVALVAIAPEPLAADGHRLADGGDAAVADALVAHWRAPSDRQFYAKALLQPYAEFLAQARIHPLGRELVVDGQRCPFCGGTPQCSVLHLVDDSASGGGRRLLCATCLGEWPVRRVLCVHCGEEDERKLGYFQTPAFDCLRVDACDTCQRYLKAVDLTRVGLAVPLVDEVAGGPLDIWARERGYTKIELNLLGL